MDNNVTIDMQSFSRFKLYTVCKMRRSDLPIKIAQAY